MYPSVFTLPFPICTKALEPTVPFVGVTLTSKGLFVGEP